MNSLSNWQRVNIKEVCSSIIDCVNKTAKTVNYKTPYKMLRTTNIKKGWIDIENVNFVTEEIYKKWTRRQIPKKGDIILTREAPLGEVGMLRTDGKFFLGQRLVAYRADPQKLDNRFLLYSFLSHDLVSQVKAFGSGSTVEHMRVPDAEKLTLLLPTLKTQQEIASILSSYDDLIENNEKRIKILEEMAQRLYTEWFVKFKFPGHEKVKMIDSGTEFGLIPERWEVKTVDNLLSTVKRKSKIKSTEYLDMGFYPVVDQGKDIIAGYTDDLESVYTEDLIVFGDHTRCLKYCNFSFACGADGTQLLKTNDQERMPQILLFYTLLNAGLGNYHYARHFKFLKALKVLKPDFNSALRFGEQVSSYYEMIQKLRQVNYNLSQIRDLLIPQLITGKRELV